MDGIGGITSRIAEIQARIASLQPAVPVAVLGTRAATGTTATGASFATALSGAVASTAATGAPPNAASVGAPATTGATTSGARRSDGVPVELAEHGNGRIPPGVLTSIGGGHTMWAPAAASFERLRAAAARDGVTFGVTDSYRSYDQQVDVARRKGLYSQGGLAARPGTSEHGWGLSLDLDLDGRALTWMRAHAEEFGFSENVPREPWHWTFTG